MNLNLSGKKQKKEQSKIVSVYFGHENWNLVINMMIGIRTSIKQLYLN